jgi:hypothetical protein
MTADESDDYPTKPIADHIQQAPQARSPEALMLEKIAETALRANALFDLEIVPVVYTRTPQRIKEHEEWTSSDKPSITKIALLSLPVRIDLSANQKLGKPRGGDLVFERFDHFDLCVRHPDIDQKVLDNWHRQLLDSYRKAAESGAEFICANELAFPSFWGGRPPVSGRRESVFQFGLDAKDLQRSKLAFEEELQAISTKHDCIILPGTYHDPITFENVAPVIFPHHTNTIDSKKYTSAHSAGEYIKVSRFRRIPVYSYGSTVFSVLICSDAFDLHIFFRHMIDRAGPAKEKNVEIFFVPSFYKKDSSKRNSMMEACRQLSWATGSLVVFVDHFATTDRDCKAIFMCGEKDWSSSRKGCCYYDINWKKFNEGIQSFNETRKTIFNNKY